MRRSGIYECGNPERGVGDKRRSEWNAERVRIRESGRVESYCLGKCTGRVNAVLNQCGGLRTAQTFFESPFGDSFSLACAALAFALAVEELALLQFAAV